MLGQGKNRQQRPPDPAFGRMINAVGIRQPNGAEKIKPRDRRSTGIHPHLTAPTSRMLLRAKKQFAPGHKLFNRAPERTGKSQIVN